MGRKFKFFDWAKGNPSKIRRDFQRLLIALGGVIGVIGILVVSRMLFWSHDSNGKHPHEKGPHGGMVIAIDKGASHHHGEVLVEEDGRIHLYLSGDQADQPVEVSHQLLIAQAKHASDENPTSLIFRPETKPDATTKRTSHFVGRFNPEMMGGHLSVSVARLEIDGEEVSFQFELPDRHDGKRRAAELVRSVVLTPKGQYTWADTEAEKQGVPTEKYRELKVIHDMRPKPGDRLCPVTRAKAAPRIQWQVDGRTYLFCCPPCIVDFIEAARASIKPMIAPEQLVKKD